MSKLVFHKRAFTDPVSTGESEDKLIYVKMGVENLVTPSINWAVQAEWIE